MSEISTVFQRMVPSNMSLHVPAPRELLITIRAIVSISHCNMLYYDLGT